MMTAVMLRVGPGLDRDQLLLLAATRKPCPLKDQDGNAYGEATNWRVEGDELLADLIITDPERYKKAVAEIREFSGGRYP